MFCSFDCYRHTTLACTPRHRLIDPPGLWVVSRAHMFNHEGEGFYHIRSGEVTNDFYDIN